MVPHTDYKTFFSSKILVCIKMELLTVTNTSRGKRSLLLRIHDSGRRNCGDCEIQLLKCQIRKTSFCFQLAIPTPTVFTQKLCRVRKAHWLSLSKGGSSLRLLSGLRVSTNTVHGFSWSAKSCTCWWTWVFQSHVIQRYLCNHCTKIEHTACRKHQSRTDTWQDKNGSN